MTILRFPGYNISEEHHEDLERIEGLQVGSKIFKVGNEIHFFHAGELIFRLPEPINSVFEPQHVASIKEAIWKLTLSSSSLLNVQLDVSLLSRFSSAMIIALVLRANIFQKLNIHYQNAEYIFNGKELNSQFLEDGFLQYLQDFKVDVASIPYCEGKYTPSSYRNIAHLYGVDFLRTIHIVRGYEPSSVCNIGFCKTNPKSQVYNLTSIRHDSCVQAIMKLREWKGSIKDYINNRRAQPIVMAAGWKSHLVGAVCWSVLESEVPIFIPVPDAVIDVKRIPLKSGVIVSIERQ